MDSTQTSSALPPPVSPAQSAAVRRRNAVTIKLLFIAGLVLLLQVPLSLINNLREERAERRGFAKTPVEASVEEAAAKPGLEKTPKTEETMTKREIQEAGYHMTYRSLKYGVLVMGLVFTAFFLFEVLAGLRLHPVHYGLVGAALCLFYMALLALGEVLPPGLAYAGAAVASSALIVLYSAAILHGYGRAALIAGLLAAVHSTLYVVLRMDKYALLAGTAALFVALGAVMYFSRKVDWSSEETGRAVAS
ncbi:MAG: inner membrane CreD family protein [Verrucomicrobia bacterium]|nr:inner membrane CreD family protein [Verrucomicrobiota bacterium]